MATTTETALSPSSPIISPPPNHSLLLEQRCSICNDPLTLPNTDGSLEHAAILPCGHVFGATCIKRWLEESSHHDCPACRRPILYSKCGHVIEACEIQKAPACVGVEGMPEWCLRCLWGGMVDAEVKVHALRGIKICLPRIWGGMARETESSVDRRIEELRSVWMGEVEDAVKRVEERGVRERW